MTPRRTLLALLATAAAAASLPAGAQTATKDIVLDQVNAAPAASAAASAGDAMVVSVLLEAADGTLSPRPVNGAFRTGDRFRVKLLPSRDGMVALYNTNPAGETRAQPVWRGKVARGLETITPRLRLEGTRGTDKLHIVLEPPRESNVVGWLRGWLGGSRKDIRLDEQNTPAGTYLLGAPAGGLVTTLQITHR